jgi:ABC-type glycerol-3-phosphate transport system substrate-binding protein
MKKALAIALAAVMCTGAFSCGKKYKQAPAEALTAVKIGDVAYSKERIKVPEEIKAIYTFSPYSGEERFFICGMGQKAPQFWTTDLEFTDCTELAIPDFDIGYSYNISVADDGTVIELVNKVDYGDLPDPDPESPDYNEAEYKAAAEYTLAVRTYDPTGSLVSDCPVTGYGTDPDDSTSISTMTATKDIVVAELDFHYEIFGTDGNYIGELCPGEDDTVEAVGTDGTDVVCAVKDKDGLIHINKVGAAFGRLTETGVTFSTDETLYGTITPATGDYSMYVRTYTTIYGVKRDGSAVEPLCSTSKAAHTAQSVTGFGMNAAGQFVLVVTTEDFTPCVERLTEIDPAELANQPLLTIGFPYQDYYLSPIINSMSSQAEGYRVDIKSYDTSSDSYMDEITQDALAGDLPDILVMDRSHSFGGIDLAGMGALCDLYEFMDSDPGFGRDKFIPNVLNAFSEGGKLYAIPHKFSIDAGYTCKTKYVPAEGFNVWTGMQMLDNKPETMIRFNEYSPDDTSRRMWFVDNRTWVDFDDLTVKFDTPEFIEYLNFVKRAPIDGEEYYANMDWTEGSPEERKNITDQLRALMDDISLFYQQGIGSYNQYLTMKEGVFAGEPFTILGTPDMEGSHIRLQAAEPCLSINATSQNKDIAWDFIKILLADEAYETRFDWAGFPPTLSGLAAQEAHERQPQTYGDLPDYDGYVYWAGYKDDGTVDVMQAGYVDDDIVAAVNELIDTAEPVANSSAGFGSLDVSNDFYTIYYEEVDKFLNGEYTAEQCAEILQSRLSIFISERLG